MGKVLRVGIGGYGRSGCDIHAAWLKEAPAQFQVVAVADQLPERREDAVRDFGCAVYDDYQELLAKTEMDLFINALPSFLHAPVTAQALQAGFNVVCEKPSGSTVAQFDQMANAAQQAGKLFAPFQNSRFYPFFRKMREVIDSGVLGEILLVRTSWGSFGRRWDWQTLQEMSGGNLRNTGPHPLDHAIMLFGRSTPQVFCRMRAIQHCGGDADDFTLVTLYGEGAPTIEITLNSYLAYPPEDMYNISGTLGGMAGGPGSLRWKYYDPAQAPVPERWHPWSDNRKYCSEQLPWVEETWEPSGDEGNSFRNNSRAFYNNIYDVLVNGAELIVKHEQVRRQIAVIEECHRQNPLPKRNAVGIS
ncbi:MAG: Gfo/Idh/MocA family protein [Armatimonadota bacterium]